MSTAQEQNDVRMGEAEKSYGSNGIDHANGLDGAKARKPYDYGGNPLYHAHTNSGESARLASFGGELQPGLYKVDTNRKIANPAPLGLCGFALTTFLLSLINLGTRGLSEPNLVIGAAFAYGGLVQLLAGMWEMAIGNTFGASKSSSFLLFRCRDEESPTDHYLSCSFLLRRFLDRDCDYSDTRWI